jgi:hypothetical protein
MATGRPVYTATIGHTSYARLCRVVVELSRDVLWELLDRRIPANTLPNEVSRNIQGKNKSLHLYPPERIRLSSPAAPTRIDCDESVLYRLLRAICTCPTICTNVCPKIPVPSNGWGKEPGTADFKIEDDIERIHQLRCVAYGHVTSAEICDADFQQHWQMMKGVCGRLDAVLGSQYVAAMDRLEVQAMDPGTEQCLMDQLLDMYRKEIDIKEALANLDASTKKGLEQLGSTTKQGLEQVDSNTKKGFDQLDSSTKKGFQHLERHVKDSDTTLKCK